MKYVLVNLNDFITSDFAAGIQALAQLGASQVRLLRSFSTVTSVLPSSRTLRQFATAFELGQIDENSFCRGLSQVFPDGTVCKLALTYAWKQLIEIPPYLDTYLSTLLQIQEEQKGVRILLLGSFDKILYERLRDYTIIGDPRFECLLSFEAQRSGNDLLKEAFNLLSKKGINEFIVLRNVEQAKPSWWPFSFIWAPLVSWRHLNWLYSRFIETNTLKKHNVTLHEWPENPEALNAQLRLHEILGLAIHDVATRPKTQEYHSLEPELVLDTEVRFNIGTINKQHYFK